MKKTNSMKTLKKRGSAKAYKVKRGKRIYYIDPLNPKFKARQG